MTSIISKREKDVLNLIAQEMTSTEIADELIISHHTVISHRKNLLYKLDAKNSAGMIIKALKTGLLQIDLI
jgi:DNA-binding CsgD family transcriptional regulator